MSKPPPDWCKKLRDCEVRCDNCPENEMSKQEPVAWGVDEGEGRCIDLHDLYFTHEEAQHMAQLKGPHAKAIPLYAEASKYQRQRLTEEEIRAAIRANDLNSVKESALKGFCDYISSMLREKNT